MSVPAVLALADGTVFRGQSIGAKGNTTGEVVFNTAITGYQEILTDPSYARQIVTLTYPHIGNTGTTPEDLESPQIYAAGLVIRDLALLPSSWRANESLPEFLERGRVVAIAGHRHAQAHAHPAREGRAGRLHHDRRDQVDQNAAVKAARAFPGLKGMDLAKVVSTQARLPVERGQHLAATPDARRSARNQRLHVVAYDFGIKRNILRLLADGGCRMTVVPAQTSADEVLALEPDGIFLSNGPGDPEPCDYAITAIATVPRDRPADLRHLSRPPAAGARQRRAHREDEVRPPRRQPSGAGPRVGARVHHQPEPRLRGRRGDAAGERARPTHRSLFDGTLQGLALHRRPAFSFQGHPEASPGPHDLRPLFERFIHLMLRRLQAQLKRARGKPAPPAGDGALTIRCRNEPTSRAS